jgi:hypothetical protein
VQDVNITNTSVPVTIQGTPTVKAAISNSPNVKILSSTATPVNTADSSADRASVLIYGTGNMPNPSTGLTEGINYSPPAGKRLVVDYVSATSNSSFAGKYAASVAFEVDENGSLKGVFMLPMVGQSTNSFYALGSAPLHFVVDSTQVLKTFVRREAVNSNDTTVDTFSVAGHLVSYP